MAIERNTIIILQQDASPFTTMFNDVLQGITNTAALGVYCYLSSKPTTWNVNKEELKAHFKCGIEHINSCIKYLKNIGVLIIESLRNEKGQIIRWIWTLKRHLPTPVKEETTIRETHILDNPVSGKSATINKKNIEIKDFINTSGKKGKFGITEIMANNPHEIPLDYIEQWIRNRGRHKVTELVWKRINKNLSELRERGINPVDAFERMVAAGWRSLEIDYFKQQFKSSGGNDKTSQWDVESVWNA